MLAFPKPLPAVDQDLVSWGGASPLWGVSTFSSVTRLSETHSSTRLQILGIAFIFWGAEGTAPPRLSRPHPWKPFPNDAISSSGPLIISIHNPGSSSFTEGNKQVANNRRETPPGEKEAKRLRCRSHPRGIGSRPRITVDALRLFTGENPGADPGVEAREG